MARLEIGFRVDASVDIGTGHVLRCLTLADELRRQECACRFVCREHPGHLIASIREHGFEALVLPCEAADKERAHRAARAPEDYAAWLGTDQAADAAQSRSALGHLMLDWLVVDHYALDECWEKLMRPAARHILAVDDLANRRHDCDVLLDQNLGREIRDYTALLPEDGVVLAGPHYALLRPEFAARRQQSLQMRTQPSVQQLLVAMGGVDKDNVTLDVLKGLAFCVLPQDCRIVVVMGVNAPGLESVRDFAGRMPGQTEVRVNEKDMAALMAASDAAIGAAGMTAWERCCLGVPAVVIVMAENQRSGAEALRARGAVLLVDGKLPFEESFRKELPKLLDPLRLTKMKTACISAVDGNGTKRVVEELLRVNF